MELLDLTSSREYKFPEGIQYFIFKINAATNRFNYCNRIYLTFIIHNKNYHYLFLCFYNK